MMLETWTRRFSDQVAAVILTECLFTADESVQLI